MPLGLTLSKRNEKFVAFEELSSEQEFHSFESENDLTKFTMVQNSQRSGSALPFLMKYGPEIHLIKHGTFPAFRVK